MRIARGLAGVALLVALMGLVACDSGSGDGDGTPAADTIGGGGDDVAGPPEGAVRQTIVAAVGGTLATADDLARVVFTTTTLSEDVEVWVTTLPAAGMPDADRLGSPVFSFGPDGLAFAANATISLKLETSPPTGARAVIATLVDGAWQEVPNSSNIDGRLIAGISHFSEYAVYFIGGDMVVDVTADEGCKDLAFTACGGDVTGAWTGTAYCRFAPIVAPGPGIFAQINGCATAQTALVVTWVGAITFEAGGTLTSDLTPQTYWKMVMDDACLTSLGSQNSEYGTGPASICAAAGADSGAPWEGECTYADGACTCIVDRNGEEPVERTGTWSADGTNLTTDLGQGVEPMAIPYCLDGDTLVLELTPTGEGVQPGDVDHFVLTRAAE